MELLQLLRILRKHTAILRILCATATLGTLLVTYVLPEEYEATPLVSVRPQTNVKINSTKENKELVNFPLGRSQLAKAEIPSNTCIETIKSHTMAQRVVRLLRLDVERQPSFPAVSQYDTQGPWCC